MPMQKLLKDYPRRGHIYIADLESSFGREIHKKRPVLIISNNISNQNTPYAVIIPTSSVVPNVIPEGIVYLGKLRSLDKESILLPLFIRSIDQNRLVKRIGKLSKEKLKKVEYSLKLVLGLVSID